MTEYPYKEIKLIGSPNQVTIHIERIINGLKSGEMQFFASHNKDNTLAIDIDVSLGKYRRLVYFLDDEPDPNDAKTIGEFTLQSLPNSKTLMIIKPKNGLDAPFNYALKVILTELKKLGFVESIPLKMWKFLKELKERIPGV